MGPLLSELYFSSKETYKLTLIGGEKGLLNTITCVYLIEDLGTTNLLRGNELTITTGLLASTKKNWILELVKELIDQQCSGLIITTGKYIIPKDISKDVISLCDSSNFPLFMMPSKIHISDVMQNYWNKIVINTYQKNTLSRLFQNIIFNPETSSTHIPLLNSNGFETEASYRIIKVSNISSPLKLQNCMNHLSIKSHIFLKDHHYILILKNCSQKTIDTLLKNYYKMVDEIIASNPSVLRPHIGIGENVSSLSQLPSSYSDASYALKVAEIKNRDFLCFSNLGILRILLSVPNKELLHNIYIEALGILIDYDRDNKTDLLNTLRLYLDFDGSIQKTADALYTHRNTINYRIKKIRSLLQNDLTSTDYKFNLKMAFYIKEMLEI